MGLKGSLQGRSEQSKKRREPRFEAGQRRRGHKRAPSNFQGNRKNTDLRIAVILTMKIKDNFQGKKKSSYFESWWEVVEDENRSMAFGFGNGSYQWTFKNSFSKRKSSFFKMEALMNGVEKRTRIWIWSLRRKIGWTLKLPHKTRDWSWSLPLTNETIWEKSLNFFEFHFTSL